MDTIYYNLNAKKVKVSGGADLTRYIPVAVPAPVPAPIKGGKEVLDFARCRRQLETKAAWKDLKRTADRAAPVFVQEEPEAEDWSPRARRSHRWSDCMEIMASAAVILAGVCAAWAFLALL